MAGRTPHEALTTYLAPLQQTLLCITRHRLVYRSKHRLVVGQRLSITMNQMTPVPIRGRHPLLFTAGQIVQVTETDARHPPTRFDVRATAYLYEVAHVAGGEVLSFHWTSEMAPPGMVTYPHMHVGAGHLAVGSKLRLPDFHKIHVPTGPLSLRAVVHMLIAEFGVAPLRPDWQATLQRTALGIELDSNDGSLT